MSIISTSFRQRQRVLHLWRQLQYVIHAILSCDLTITGDYSSNCSKRGAHLTNARWKQNGNYKGW